MQNLFKPNVDESVVDNLITGTLVPEKVIEVKVSGTGVVKRGTLLTSADGVSFHKSDLGATTPEEIHAVLLLDADASDTNECIKPAAFGGEFNQNVIDAVMEDETPALSIHKARARQIFIAPANPAPDVF